MINKETAKTSYTTVADQSAWYAVDFEYLTTPSTGLPQLSVTLDGAPLNAKVDYITGPMGIQLTSVPEAGKVLIIRRDIPFTQDLDFQMGIIDPEMLEKGLDESVMRDQELLSAVHDNDFDIAVLEDMATDLETRADALETKTDEIRATAEDAVAKAASAVNIAGDAVATAEAANTTASSAKEIAEGANTTATHADAYAQEAYDLSNNAIANSTEALNTANNASKVAQDASELANSYSDRISATEETASAAQTAASAAQAAATSANTKSQAATTAASNAKSIAQQASTDAASAVQTAVDATNVADAANNKATQALSAAQGAQETARAVVQELTTVKNDQRDLGDQVSGIESKIPGSASETNQLATKDDLSKIDALPTQEGNAGKFLTTNGTDASWAEIQGGVSEVFHDTSLSGKGTETEPLSVARPAAIIREW